MSFMPDSDSEDELPPGWEEQATENGLVCYVNQQTKITQMTHPRTGRTKRLNSELPIGWEKRFDEETKKTFFYNNLTQQTTNIDPRLAFAAEEPPMNISQVRQRFDGSTTALQILHGKDLHGRLAIVTGANCGIGYETARSLAFHGCEVIMACRSRSATEEAIERIAKERSACRSRLRWLELDLASFKSVCNFIEEVKQNVKHVDFLILNAGVFGLPYSVTENGIETTFQVCHLSHFYLTIELEALFDHKTRIVVVSSESHRFGKLPADNLTPQDLSPPPDQYLYMAAYNNAKLCNVLFASKLAKLWKHRGISVFSLHPGNLVSSNLSRNWWALRLLFALARPYTKSLQQAAATTIYCATANELTGLTGLYFNNCYFCEPSKLSQNELLQNQVWGVTQEMIHIIKHSQRSEQKSGEFVY